MTDQPDWIEFQISAGSHGLNAVGADEVLHAFLDLLKALDRELSPHGGEVVTWEIVEAKMQSPLTLRFRGNDSAPVISAAAIGLALLNDSNACPDHFTPDALASVKKLVSQSARFGLASSVLTPTNTVLIGHSAASNADWAMKNIEVKKRIRRKYGSFRGELKELSSSHRREDRLVLVDRLTGEEIPCYVGESLDKDVREAWKRRVEVTGRIETNRATKKKSIHVEKIRILRERNQLPQIKDLHGIDLTDGVESSEYIRNLRDADED